MSASTITVQSDLDEFLQVLPPRLVQPLREEGKLDGLVEVVLDLGRRPEARFSGDLRVLSEGSVERADLGYVAERVEALYGVPAAPLPTAYRYESLGITVWFSESGVVESVVLEAPYAGTTAGGNGIGSSLEAFRSEFGNVDVPDQAGNFRVWEVAGLAADFDADGLARAIQVFPPE